MQSDECEVVGEVELIVFRDHDSGSFNFTSFVQQGNGEGLTVFSELNIDTTCHF